MTMNFNSRSAMSHKVLLVSGAFIGLLSTQVFGTGADVPDALSVEWQGKKPCELLGEDPQIRIMRCTFPPGAKHLRHSHPATFNYVLNGGKVQVQDENGTRVAERPTGGHMDSPPVTQHEVTNVGDTTLQFLVVEKKYQPVSATGQDAIR
jgi:quercetin dioxygenase-like cupin family protein